MLLANGSMRLIGLISNETNAKAFGDYLTSLDILNSPEPEPDGQWAVWVHSEDQMEAGRNALATFLANPKDPKFQRASAQKPPRSGAARRRPKATMPVAS